MQKIKDLLKNDNIVAVEVVHDLNLAAKFADNILLLNKGKVLASGKKEEVLTRENIKASYHLDPIIRYENNSMCLFFYLKNYSVFLNRVSIYSIKFQK